MIFMYYAGHGGMVNNYLVSVLNEKRNYPIEKQLRTIAEEANSYVVALFDCCRETLPQASRGGGDTGPDLADA